MSQAEIAGGVVTPGGELPSKGRLLHDFDLVSAAGQRIWLSDYRSRLNLVLIFADDRAETSKLLFETARQHAQIREEQGEVLAVVQQSQEQAAQTKRELALPYPVLVDESGELHRQMGATNSRGPTAAAVYVTDRFGEVFGLYRTRDGQALPAVADILNWLEFINSQCPECEPPEWPA